MNRRELLSAGPLAALPAGKMPPPKVEEWVVERCPKCGRDVCFLPAQRRNKCAWCGRVVRR